MFGGWGEEHSEDIEDPENMDHSGDMEDLPVGMATGSTLISIFLSTAL